MADVRRIKKVWKAKPTIEGAGVHLKRVFGYHEVPQLDPFLLLDDFRSNDPAEYVRGFPWHPHRGIETITYVLAGDVEHGDSLGNRGVISSGDVQWMTAGSGIIHQEMPKGDREGRMWGFQLWANLPARHKMMDPRYREVKRDDIPEATTAEGATVRVVCGEVAGDTDGRALGRRRLRDVVPLHLSVARIHHLVARGEVRPELETPHPALAVALRHLLVDDAAAGGHPLHVPRRDDAAVPEAVPVLHVAGEDVRDRLDAAVRVPGEPADVLGRVVRTEVVEEEERVELRYLVVAEHALQADAGALDGRFCLPDLLDPADVGHRRLLRTRLPRRYHDRPCRSSQEVRRKSW